MTDVEALDVFFGFFPKEVLGQLVREGLYEPILSGQVSSAAELYDHLSEEHAALQDADYSVLADELLRYLKRGSVLQIGCGRGDLLRLLAQKGCAPIYGLDRSRVMLKKARERLAEFERVYLFEEKVEGFDFSSLGVVDNVILNNFWGMISEQASIELLNRLKPVAAEGPILIGPYHDEVKITPEIRLAERTLREHLGFTFAYPFFKDFQRCGYRAQTVRLAGLPYFILTQK